MGREVGDLNGAGDVGESEYGEKAEMRERSGEDTRGDFKAIIIAKRSGRPWGSCWWVGDQLIFGEVCEKEEAEMMDGIGKTAEPVMYLRGLVDLPKGHE